ncbi:MAG: endosialidase [Lachnospiraceae bacterium]|nr:endosialidase [Lachnospiraceae bacterium]
MAVIEELIRLENNGTLSFGNYLMDEKKKVLDFEVEGNLYKVKTFKEITKLEKNGKFLVEVVPGATVHEFFMDDKKVSFKLESNEDIQVTMELEPEKEYKIIVDDVTVGKVKSGLSGKINFSVEICSALSDVKIEKIL